MPSKKLNRDVFYINTTALLANKAGAEAVGMVIDLLVYVWYPNYRPFRFDPEELSRRLNKEVPARGYTPEVFERRREKILSHFIELPDGLWAPSPKYFILLGDDGKPVSVE